MTERRTKVKEQTKTWTGWGGFYRGDIDWWPGVQYGSTGGEPRLLAVFETRRDAEWRYMDVRRVIITELPRAADQRPPRVHEEMESKEGGMKLFIRRHRDDIICAVLAFVLVAMFFAFAGCVYHERVREIHHYHDRGTEGGER